ncbi:hypothetical protein [Pontibacter sp. HSC-36F09]|uniref:hypothetical protein n=1 Tax=Pontibacter sp. HSC-36F09 TaxID=2910966 RepID=UPI00209E2A1F|nr:hypothetical protein [Pontibacter sp. HSC-36F09]MCP2044891.1 hypothetical protein [Pontibacter sp. HSC-36F09]
MKFKTSKRDFINFLIAAIVLLGSGIWMIVNDLVAVGVHGKTLSASGYGGHLLILVSLIFFYVAYHCLSPFSKIRRFFEGGWRRKKK